MITSRAKYCSHIPLLYGGCLNVIEGRTFPWWYGHSCPEGEHRLTDHETWRETVTKSWSTRVKEEGCQCLLTSYSSHRKGRQWSTRHRQRTFFELFRTKWNTPHCQTLERLQSSPNHKDFYLLSEGEELEALTRRYSCAQRGRSSRCDSPLPFARGRVV